VSGPALISNQNYNDNSSPIEKNVIQIQNKNLSTIGNTFSRNNSATTQSYTPVSSIANPVSLSSIQPKDNTGNKSSAGSNPSQSILQKSNIAQSSTHNSGLPSGLNIRGKIQLSSPQNSYSSLSRPNNGSAEKVCSVSTSQVQPNPIYYSAPANMTGSGIKQTADQQSKESFQPGQVRPVSSTGMIQNIISGTTQNPPAKLPTGNQQSPVMPTATQLHSQISELRRRGSEETPATANISRQGSRDCVASGRETPSFRSLQERYGTPTSPTEFVLIAGKTPLSDIDYQKSARHTVIGELARQGTFFINLDLNHIQSFM
jgi:hypothetical protein